MSKTVTVQAQQKWEFCISTRKTETALLADLNPMGQEGWELVSVEYYKDAKGTMSWTAFLKRPSSGQAAPPSAPEKASPVIVQPTAKPKDATPGSEGFDLGDGEFEFQAE